MLRNESLHDETSNSLFTPKGKSFYEEKKPYKLAFCNDKCLQKSQLDVHIESLHEGKKPYKCSFCEYTFSLNSALKTHICS